MGAKSRPQSNKDDLLNAGWDVIKEELGWREGRFVREEDMKASAVLNCVRARDVTARARVSPGLFYRRWDDIGEYLKELCQFILDRKPSEYEYLMAAQQEFERITDPPRTISEIVRDVTTRDLAVTSESIDFAVQMFLWTLSRRYPELRDLLTSHYGNIDSEWQRNYMVAMGFLGLRLRPDVSPSDLAIMLTALSEGLAIRTAIEGEVVTRGLLGTGVMAILASVVDWDRSSVSLESWLGQLSPRS